VAALATQGLLAKLPANVAYPALTLVAAVTAWLAGSRAAGIGLGQIRGGASRPASSQPAADPGYGGDDSLDLYRDGYRHFDDSAAFAAYVNGEYDTGGYRAPGGAHGSTDGARGNAGYGGTGERGAAGYGDTGGFRADPVEPVTGAFDPLFRPNSSAAPGQAAGRSGSDAATLNRAGPGLTPGEDIEFATGMQLPAIDDVIEAAVAAAGAVDTDRLYGRIAIYTLLDAGAEEFDRLAEQVVDQVRTGEPDTLAYVVHGVPSAPLQRILYQLYSDRAAYDRHQERPYVADFEARRRPLVLATNVIELGVRQAKVAAVTPRRVP
jgi:quinol monooxygenase YgiN